MTDHAEPLKIKLARRMMLNNLNILYPTPVMLRTLFRTLITVDPTYDESLFIKDVTYLLQKGYVQFINNPLAGDKYKDHLAQLTASGKEIAERTATDSALEI